LPSHTLGGGDGIITVSSTDGFTGVTRIDISDNPFNGKSIKWSTLFPNLTVLLLNYQYMAIPVDSLLDLDSLKTLYICGSANNNTNITGDGWKLNSLTSLEKIKGYYSKITMIFDSLYSWNHMKYFDWMREGSDAYGNVSVVENWSPDLYVFSIASDSGYGDGSVFKQFSDLTILGVGGLGANLKLTGDDVDSLTNLTDLTAVGDSVTIDLASLELLTKLTHLNLGGSRSYGDIVVCGYMPCLTVIELEHTGAYGSVGVFDSCAATINVINCHHTGVDDDLAKLSNCDIVYEYQLDSTAVSVTDRFLSPVCYWVYFDSCGMSQAEVDLILHDYRLLIEEGDVTPTHWIKFRLRGNAPPSAAGLADTTYIDSACTANGTYAEFYVDE